MQARSQSPVAKNPTASDVHVPGPMGDRRTAPTFRHCNECTGSLAPACKANGQCLDAAQKADAFAPPASVQAAARRGLAAREKWGRGGLSTQEAGAQGIGSGVARATTLANGDRVSVASIRAMARFFARHQENYRPSATEPDGGPTAGTIAWWLWGGDPGKAWADRVLADLDEADKALRVRRPRVRRPAAGGSPDRSFDPNEHPRFPPGHPQAGQFRPKPGGAAGGGGAAAARPGMPSPDPRPPDLNRHPVTADYHRQWRDRAQRRVGELQVALATRDLNRAVAVRTTRGDVWNREADDFRTAVIRNIEAGGGARRQVAMPALGAAPSGPVAAASHSRATARMNELSEAAASGDLRRIEAIATTRADRYNRAVDEYRTSLVAHFRGGGGPIPRPTVAGPSGPRLVPPPTPAMTTQQAAAVSRRATDDRLGTTVPDTIAATRANAAATGASIRNARTVQPAAPPRPPTGNPAANDHIGPDGFPTRHLTGASTPSIGLPGLPNSPVIIPQGRGALSNVTVAVGNRDRILAAARQATPQNFVPRPLVPFSHRVDVAGLVNTRTGVVTPWRSSTERLYAEAYLAQSTSAQQAARTALERARPDLVFQATTAPPARAAAATREFDRPALQDPPEMLRPRNTPGHNVSRLDVAGDKASWQEVFPGYERADVEQFAKELIADYGSPTRFTVSARASGRQFEVSYSGADGTTINRQFTRNADGTMSVYHAYFRAGSRGQGAGSSFFRTALGTYVKHGVTRIGVTANIDVGGYAWARFGFVPQQSAWDSLRTGFKARVQSPTMYRTLTPDQRRDLVSILDDPDPRAMWKLADAEVGGQKIGKDMLLGTNWRGEVDLTDEANVRRFVSYVTRND
ncbi:MAG: hypothetical protein ACK53W_12720 [Gemmatimonadota bacterium]